MIDQDGEYEHKHQHQHQHHDHDHEQPDRSDHSDHTHHSGSLEIGSNQRASYKDSTAFDSVFSQQSLELLRHVQSALNELHNVNLTLHQHEDFKDASAEYEPQDSEDGEDEEDATLLETDPKHRRSLFVKWWNELEEVGYHEKRAEPVVGDMERGQQILRGLIKVRQQHAAEALERPQLDAGASVVTRGQREPLTSMTTNELVEFIISCMTEGVLGLIGLKNRRAQDWHTIPPRSLDEVPGHIVYANFLTDQ